MSTHWPDVKIKRVSADDEQMEYLKRYTTDPIFKRENDIAVMGLIGGTCFAVCIVVALALGAHQLYKRYFFVAPVVVIENPCFRCHQLGAQNKPLNNIKKYRKYHGVTEAQLQRELVVD